MKFEKLKNIVEVKKGKKPSFVDTPDENSVRVLQIDDLRNDTNPKFTNDKTGVFAKEDDVLIAWDGANAGTIGYGKSGYIGSTIALLRKKQPDLYSTTFIGIFLQSQYQYLRSKTTGATIPHISRKALDELEVPVISVNDQLHIANLLSKAENLIAKRKESIRLLDEFLKSMFLEMFGEPFSNPKKWDKKTLNEICLKKGQYGSGASAVEYSPDKPRYVRITDIKDDGSLSSDLKAPSTEPEEWKDYELNVGDILFARSGATVGKTYMHADIYGNCIYAGYLIRFVPKKDVMLPTFLFHFTRTNYYKSWILDNQSVMAQPNINANQYGNNLKVIVPPIALQAQFAQIVEKTEALKTQYQQSLQELENLYGSLSQRAFRGELGIKQVAVQ